MRWKVSPCRCPPGRQKAPTRSPIYLSDDTPVCTAQRCSHPDGLTQLQAAGAVVWKGERGSETRLMLTTGGPSAAEIWRWTLEPGEEFPSHPHLADVTETVSVTRGEMLLVIDGADYPVAGARVAFPWPPADDNALPSNDGAVRKRVETALSVVDDESGARFRGGVRWLTAGRSRPSGTATPAGPVAMGPAGRTTRSVPTEAWT